jgi:hypothetical protein
MQASSSLVYVYIDFFIGQAEQFWFLKLKMILLFSGRSHLGSHEPSKLPKDDWLQRRTNVAANACIIFTCFTLARMELPI